MLEELWSLVASIPRGKVTSYGDLGRALSQPASGYQVGRWMAQCPEQLPWWRVVSKTGNLPLSKRSPGAAIEQRAILEREGVEFLEGQVDIARFGWVP